MFEDILGRYRPPSVTGVDSATRCELSNLFGNTWRLVLCLLLIVASALCCSSTSTTPTQLGASSERRTVEQDFLSPGGDASAFLQRAFVCYRCPKGLFTCKYRLPFRLADTRTCLKLGEP